MSLRDWLAGMALQGLLANNTLDLTKKEYAQEALIQADAVLKAREEKPQ